MPEEYLPPDITDLNDDGSGVSPTGAVVPIAAQVWDVFMLVNVVATVNVGAYVNVALPDEY